MAGETLPLMSAKPNHVFLVALALANIPDGVTGVPGLVMPRPDVSSSGTARSFDGTFASIGTLPPVPLCRGCRLMSTGVAQSRSDKPIGSNFELHQTFLPVITAPP